MKDKPTSQFNKGDRVLVTIDVMRIQRNEQCTVVDVKPGGIMHYVLVETDDRRTAWVGESRLQPA